MPKHSRAASVYLLFVVASWLASALGNELLLFAWPHLAGMALQEIGGDTELGVAVLQILGLLPPLFIERALAAHVRRPPTWLAAGAIAIASMALMTAACMIVAFLAGWPFAA